MDKNPKHKIGWREYERAMFNDLYYRFRPPEWRVVPDLRKLRGIISGGNRQIDVAVYYHKESKRPEWAVESKRYGRRLTIKDVEEFIGMVEDLGVRKAALVAPLGFSDNALCRVADTCVTLIQLSEEDALRLNWRELARVVFPWDEGFHPQMGNAFHALINNKDIEATLDALDGIPYEEWLTTIDNLHRRRPAAAVSMLQRIAEYHPDDGWRFNAIKILDGLKELGYERIVDLLQCETDFETKTLLRELMSDV